MDQKPFRQRTIDEFLDDLGSSAPAPGGGAAAGLLGAQACALAEMVCHGGRGFETLNPRRYELYKQKNNDIRPQQTEIGYAEFPQLTGDLRRRA